MIVEYTSKLLKYQEHGATKVVFILDFNLSVENFRKFIFWEVHPGLLIPTKTIQFIEENFGSHDEYYDDFYRISRIKFISERIYEIRFPGIKFEGFVAESHLHNAGVSDLKQLLTKEDNAYVLLTNHRYGERNNQEKEAYRFYFRRGKLG